MDIEREAFEEEEEDEEITLPDFTEASAEPYGGRSHSIVVPRDLSELAPKEEVAESVYRTEIEPIKLGTLSLS